MSSSLRSSSAFHVRTATCADAAAIARIHVETWQHAYRGILPQSHLDALSVERRTIGWTNNLREKRDHVLVATVDSVVTGWISFGACRDELEAHETEIYALYVDSPRQRQGIGAQLLNEAEAELRTRFPTATRVSLWVLAQNLSARAFYEQHRYLPGPRTKSDSIGGAAFEELRLEKPLP